MVGHITYLSEERLDWRFGRREQPGAAVDGFGAAHFAVESYLDYQGRSFIDRFDANSYLYITAALDAYDAAAGHLSLVDALRRARARFLVASFSSDWLYPPRDSQGLVEALHAAGREVEYLALSSPLGHDAFLLEYNLLNPIVAEAVDR